MTDPTPPAPRDSAQVTIPESARGSDALGLAALVVAVLVCVSPWGSPQLGLLIGVALALAGLAVHPRKTRRLSRLLIQACIVLLGLKTDLHQVQQAGLSGLGFATATIAGAFVLGLALARALSVDGRLATLLCSGTAICGGSAIAATSSVIRAREDHTSIALACVFLLNAVALWAFPPIGHALGLSQHQFGAWAAIAIHDVASVVGAGKAYGEVALEDATVIKLTRVLWIVPISLLAGWWWRRHDRIASARASAGVESPSSPASAAPDPTGTPSPGAGASPLKGLIPWFIVLFLVASTLRTLVPDLARAKPALDTITTAGMSTALLLIGMGLSMKAVREVGWRALVMATSLWVALSVAALLVVRQTVP